MSLLLCGSFSDVVGTAHPVANGNLVLDAFFLDVYFMQSSLVNGSVNLTLYSNLLGNIWFEIMVAPAAGAITKPQLPPRFAFEWSKGLVLPRGDALSIQSGAQNGITQVSYTASVFGRILP